jgi:transcriptional regulator with XRE-family HTH domain
MGWYERLDERRKREGLSMRALASRLGVSSPQTIYNWRLATGRPARSKMPAIAQFLGEREGDLLIEMGSSAAVGQDELVAAMAARRLNAQWHRTHLRDVRALLGVPEDPGRGPEVEGVDLVMQLLRQRLPDHMISVLLAKRGNVLRIPYEYLVHVQADPTDPAAAVGREELQHQVLRALAGLRGPIWWDRPDALLPRGWDPANVTLISPRLLESRPPDWLDHRYEPIDGIANLLVLSVFHGGAPDVGALLASCIGYGYNTITNLAAQLGSWTMSSLRSSREIGTQTELARAITTRHSPIASPSVWSINDPEPILDEAVRDNLVGFPTARVVLLELSGKALDYAAWQVATVANLPDPPAKERVREYRDLLSKQQAGLAKIAADLDYYHTSSRLVVRVPIELPAGVGPQPDGSYADAEDSFFDLWATAALEARKWLDQFARDGHQAPDDARVREIIRPDDLLGPLVHPVPRQPAASSPGLALPSGGALS